MRNEQDILRRAQQGDSEAFRVLVETYQVQVYRLALRMCGESAADDVAQEAFLAAWRALPEFRGTCRFATWLYRLTTNAGIDYLRREKRHGHTDDITELELPDDRPTPQDCAEQAETRRAVRRALSRLSAEHREVLLLRYMQELEYTEIAAALEVSEGTVKSRISRAKARLRELLGEGNIFGGGSVLQTESAENKEKTKSKNSTENIKNIEKRKSEISVQNTVDSARNDGLLGVKSAENARNAWRAGSAKSGENGEKSGDAGDVKSAESGGDAGGAGSAEGEGDKTGAKSSENAVKAENIDRIEYAERRKRH